MRIILVQFILLLFSLKAASQTSSDTAGITTLDEVIISSNKFQEKKKNIAQGIDVITATTIANYNTQNTGDLLINTGNVFVQKSQQGGSSPVIRGFEASRVLLIVDGVRLNNAIYRSGHLQNSITVDQNMLEKIEVLYGPASTLYGSDALGGVIHFRTKIPKLSVDRNSLVAGSGFIRYSSVNDEKTIHADASIGGKKFAWLQAYNFSNFGDMKMGDQYTDKYPDFGRRSQYVTRINGIDSVVKNPDDRIQRFSGYKQWDITQKFLFKPSANITHLVNLQLSNTNDVPRYDRLQDIKNGTLRYAEWYYGPQKRIMGSYELGISSAGFINEIKANINYQDIEESRQTREYRRYDRFDSRREHLKVWAFTIDGRKKWGKNELTAGIDGQLNDVKSVADRTNINTGTKTKLDTRYPDGINKMNYFAVYAQHLYKFYSGKLVLNDGIRFQLADLKSSLVDNSFFNLPFTSIKQNNSSVTGNLGLSFLPQKNTKIAVSLASGFRSPNIDDLTKIFESSTAAKQVVFPNPDIKPEYTYNADVSLTYIVAQKLTVELTGFYTLFRNAIVKAPSTINGKDSVLYNGVMSKVLTSQNKNKATIYGFNAAVSFAFTNYLSLTSTLNYTKGSFETDATKTSSVFQKQPDGTYKLVNAFVDSKPLDHVPPIFGKTSIQLNKKTWGAELFALYNGWKKLDQYNADGEDNQQYATINGMPSWFTINARASYTFLSQHTQVQVGVENILDRNYRYFASGFSAPGRNFIVALRTNF